MPRYPTCESPFRDPRAGRVAHAMLVPPAGKAAAVAAEGYLPHPNLVPLAAKRIVPGGRFRAFWMAAARSPQRALPS